MTLCGLLNDQDTMLGCAKPSSDTLLVERSGHRQA
jgi:hypothetical protein